RLAPAITQLIDDGDYRPLEALLSDLPRDMRKVDTGALERARQYLDWAAANPQPTSLPLEPLPEEWPLIEAMFMIPLADDVASFLELREQLADSSGLSGDLLDSANIAPAVRRARACRDNMRTPVQIEAGVRHWHAIASEGCAGLHPGHFKYTQNWSARNPLLKRVDPALASATFQCFVEEIYTRVPPGMLRAAICMMVLCDLHVFADGNGRIGTIWMNRELEWNDCMPALFRRDLSLKGELATAMTTVRGNGGDLSPLLSVMLRAQHHARDFCRELAAVT
ncbi:MAG: Fic family protein, partial [Halioglobus sp.]|nr:Fic family protein [Halioglobus sp.]